jgi:hypothetical protein
LAVSTQAYWGRYDYQGVGIYPGDVPTTNVDGDRTLWYGGDAHITVTSISKQKIVAGLDFQRDARRDQYNYNLDPYTSVLDDKRSSSRTGAYVEDEIQLPANFALKCRIALRLGQRHGQQCEPASRADLQSDVTRYRETHLRHRRISS